MRVRVFKPYVVQVIEPADGSDPRIIAYPFEKYAEPEDGAIAVLRVENQPTSIHAQVTVFKALAEDAEAAKLVTDITP